MSMALPLLWLLACSAPAPETPTAAVVEAVEVRGTVRGWDGTGDVAIEACGRGALVDEEGHRFEMWTASDCPLRVVWERDSRRAEGAWHDLPAPVAGGWIEVALPMPTELQPLSPDQKAYREAVIRDAQRQLDARDPEAGEGGQADGPGV
jgi:hypothetical protein